MEIMKNTGMVDYSNKELKKATTRIFAYGASIKRSWYAIANVIASVDNTKCYKDDGFKSVHEWTEKTFGFKKSASYALLTIGKEYIVEDTNKKVYVTNLLPEGSSNDFNKTQLERMLPLGHEKAFNAVKSGLITPEMTVNEIQKTVKEIKLKEKDIDAKTDEKVVDAKTDEKVVDVKTDEKVVDAKTDENVVFDVIGDFDESEYISLWDKDGHEYKVPYQILIRYGKKMN